MVPLLGPVIQSRSGWPHLPHEWGSFRLPMRCGWGITRISLRAVIIAAAAHHARAHGTSTPFHHLYQSTTLQK
jgi:hypothetical protein